MVLAEKIVTAIQRGTANTRWRDFADIYLLARRHDIDGPNLSASLTQVADYRSVQLIALTEVLDGYAILGQARWAAWRRKNKVDDRLPEEFAPLLHDVATFADLVLTQDVPPKMWVAADRAWAVT